MKKRVFARNALITLAAFGLAALVAVYAPRGDGGSPTVVGSSFPNTSATSTPSNGGTTPSLSELEGKPVAVMDGKVTSQIGDDVYLVQVGDRPGSLLAVFDDDTRTRLDRPPQAGDKLALAGTIRRLPDDQALKEQWGISDEHADVLREEAAWYFDVQEARTPPSG